MVKVSILCTYREGRGDLARFTDSIKKQSFKDYELVVTNGDNTTIGKGYNDAFKQSKGDYIILSEADCIWHSPYMLEFVVKNIEKGKLVVWRNPSLECVGMVRDDFVPFDEEIYPGEDTAWFKSLGERGIKFQRLFEHNKAEDFMRIKRSFMYPFSYFYSDTMKPGHILIRDMYFIAQYILEIVAIPPAMLYAFVKKRMNKHGKK